MDAAVAAGFRMVEFTVSTPGVYELIAEFARRPGILVGAGTVLDLETVEAAVGAGAKFLVSPVLDPKIMAAARDLDVAILPGCFTPTELLQAYRGGAACQKLFPGPADIAGFVRAVLGPMPFLRIIPTNGVNHENAADVLAAGAMGVDPGPRPARPAPTPASIASAQASASASRSRPGRPPSSGSPWRWAAGCSWAWSASGARARARSARWPGCAALRSPRCPARWRPGSTAAGCWAPACWASRGS